MQKFKNINRILQNLGKYVSYFAIVAMNILVLADVLFRNLFGISVTGVNGYVGSILMPVLVFSTLGYTYWSEVIPRVTNFISKTPNWFQKLNNILIFLIELMIFGLLTYYGILNAVDGSLEKKLIQIGGELIPIWPLYFLVPVAYLLVILSIVVKFADVLVINFSKRKSD